MGTTRALTFTSPCQVQIEELHLADPGPEDAVVETRWSGISAGSELLAYRGQVEPEATLDATLGTLSGSFRFPFRYGYSCVGTVVSSPGEPAVGREVFAYHPHQDVLVVPARDLLPLPEVDPRQATLLPLLETALQASVDAGAVQHRPAAVLGLGPVGILTAALLSRSGCEVVGVEPQEARRRAAEAFGVATLLPGDLEEWVTRRTGGAGLPLVVEASGRQEVLSEALEVLAHEGTALVLSWYGSGGHGVRLGTTFHRRRITIRSSQVSTTSPGSLGWSVERRRHLSLELLPRLPLEILTTHAFPFEQAAEAYRTVDRGLPDLIHAALSYS